MCKSKNVRKSDLLERFYKLSKEFHTYDVKRVQNIYFHNIFF